MVLPVSGLNPNGLILPDALLVVGVAPREKTRHFSPEGLTTIVKRVG